MIVKLGDIKTYLQLNSADDDSLVLLYAELVQAEIEAYVQRPLELNTYTEYLKFNSYNSDLLPLTPLGAEIKNRFLFVENTPITELSILVDGEEVSTDNYNYNANTGVIEMYVNYDDSKNSIVAEYSAGYSTASTATFGVPSDLKLVMLEGIKSIYINNSQATKGSGNISSKKIKDFSVSYGNESTSNIAKTGLAGSGALVKTYIASNSTILNKYKRISI